jgi:hypothetical protein
MLPVRIESSAQPPAQWDAFARAHGIFYHESEWTLQLSKVFGFPATFLTAYEGEAVVGILPLLRTRTLLGRRRLTSLPFSYAAGPVARDTVTAVALVEEARASASRLGISVVEIKQVGTSVPEPPMFRRATHYSRYVLDTSGGEDAVWQRLHQSHVRRGIKKAGKLLEVERVTTEDGWRTMAQFQQETSRRHGLPAPPDAFFLDCCRHLQSLGLASLLIARLPDDRPVGAIVVWQGAREWIYAFGASRPADWEYRPNHILLWSAIQDAVARGVAFDFGRAAPEQQGLVEFKKHWGGVPQPLSYDFWPEATGLDTLPRDRGLLSAAARTWALLPLAVTRRGSIFYRYLA